MQTTLLGLAIAVILALLAALIGPYFIDWSQFRPHFEREASRVIGMPVRVDGEIDARLLPTPSLRLRGVAIGARSDVNNVSVEKLDVEFSLGDLMRGEWRANELTLNGMVLELGLDQRGRMDWASRAGSFNVGALTVDRFHVTGALALNDAASRTSLRLDDIAFTGEVRALAGSVRGEGVTRVDGVRYPFRVAMGRTADGAAQRVRLTLDPGARPLAADLDGVLHFDDALPRFDGALTVSKPAPAKSNAPLNPADAPWRIAGKLKADPASAKLEQVEAVFGPDDNGLKFTGQADARFGASPRLRASLTARQLDADRFLAQSGGAAPSPAEFLSNLRAADRRRAIDADGRPSSTSTPTSSISARVRCRTSRIDLRANAREWWVDKFEFRAPGSARVAVTGRISEPGDKANFAGVLNVEAGDPEGFALWLQGQSDNAYRSQRPLKARGDLVVSRDRVAIDALKAEVDGRPVEGAFSLAATDGKGRFDASLKAERLDFDSSAAFARAMGGALKTWPDEALLNLDIAQLNVGSQTFKPVLARFVYNAKAISLERLRIGDADGVAIDGNGSFDRTAATGQLNLGATSATLDPLARLVAPIAPEFSRRIAAVPAGAGNVWVGLALELDKPQGDRVGLRTSVDIHSPQVKGALTAAMTPQIASLRDLDTDALAKNEAALTAKLTAERGGALARLARAGRCAERRQRPGPVRRVGHRRLECAAEAEGEACRQWARRGDRRQRRTVQGGSRGQCQPQPAQGELRAADRRRPRGAGAAAGGADVARGRRRAEGQLRQPRRHDRRRARARQARLCAWRRDRRRWQRRRRRGRRAVGAAGGDRRGGARQLRAAQSRSVERLARARRVRRPARHHAGRRVPPLQRRVAQ